jgi:protoheme IX farnesyltransferase
MVNHLLCEFLSAGLSRGISDICSAKLLPGRHGVNACRTILRRSLITPPTKLNFASRNQQSTVDIRHPGMSTNITEINFTKCRRAGALTIHHRVKLYAELSKSRLTALVVLTAMSGVALSPLPTTIPILMSTALGTALCSASANTLNQLQEIPFDAQMARTRMRPLVRGSLSPTQAAGFAVITGVAGPAILWAMVNPTTAMLGAGNIALYAGLYTWLKRKTVVNTWVGAIVGALPPLMGWTACGGRLIPSSNYPFEVFPPSFVSGVPSYMADLSLVDNPLSPLAFFMLLYCWQFPHFNSLSYLMRESYAQAGYRMLSVLAPSRNSLVAVRYAIILIPICSILIPLSGLTTWVFGLTTLIPNLICTRAAWRFWRNGGEKEARIMFLHYIWFLPVILGMMMVHKQGMDWTTWLNGEDKEDQGDSQANPPK